jgi:hypothetical protein
VVQLMDRYLEIADRDLSSLESNEGYIRRTIKPGLDHLQICTTNPVGRTRHCANQPILKGDPISVA